MEEKVWKDILCRLKEIEDILKRYSPDEPRDARGRWTELYGGGKSRAEMMKEAIKTGGGFTVEYYTMRPLKSGYSVGAYPELSTSFPAEELNEGAVREWLNKNKKTLRSDPHIKVGGWLDETTGKIWLDVVKVYPRKADKAAAVKKGKEKNQISIADLWAITRGDWDHALIECGGTGEAPKKGGGMGKKKAGKKSTLMFFDADTTAAAIVDAFKKRIESAAKKTKK
jgi:hypothetical protein